MPAEKIDEFGLHAHKYYKVEHSFFKSGLDTDLLDRIWNEYWVHNLATSPLLSNQDMICKTVMTMVDKVKKLNTHSVQSYGSRSKLLQDDEFKPIAHESSKMAVEVNQGIMVEVLKKFMFACRAGEHPRIEASQEEEKKQI